MSSDKGYISFYLVHCPTPLVFIWVQHILTFISVIILKLLLPPNMAACGYGDDVRKIDWDVYLYRFVYLSNMKALFRILTVYQNNMESLLNMQIPRLRQDHVQNGEKSQGIYIFKRIYRNDTNTVSKRYTKLINGSYWIFPSLHPSFAFLS